MEKSDTPSPQQTPALAGGVYTVPADQPFLAAVARGVLDSAAQDPLKLADITLLVPNHTVGQMLRQAFREQLGDNIGILPRIEAPGSVDEDLLSLKMSGSTVLSQALMDIPPAVTKLERQMILATEILKIPSMSRSMQKALGLARQLGHLLDMMQKNNVDPAKIDTLAPARFKAQWQKTSDFLKIITDVWPRKLEEMGRIDPEERRNAVLQIQSAHWLHNPPQKTMIAVGFTDDTPATQSLLQSVSMMPKGHIVLPGLDLQMGNTSWQATTPVHPQYAYRNMLSAIGRTRADVAVWPFLLPPSPHVRANNPQRTAAARAKLISESLRPAATADGWRNLQMPKRKRAATPDPNAANDDRSIDPAALNGMDLLTCPTLQDEASVIALKFRETLEVDGRTAMLVTADSELIRRVSARLRFWGLEAEDASGTPLSMTSAGILLQATAKMGAERWGPVSLLEVLKHPLTGLGLDHDELTRRIARIENIGLRGPRPDPWAAGLVETLSAKFDRAAKRVLPAGTPEELQAEKEALLDVVTRLQAAGQEFFDLIAHPSQRPFGEYLDAHIRFVEALCVGADEAGASRAWSGVDGAAASRALTQIRSFAGRLPEMTGADYADVLYGLLPGIHVRGAGNGHPCLKIVSPEQAMMQKADVVIVGGVNDGHWPRHAAHNPWLSADMLKRLGIPAPDGGIGASALQFQLLLSNPNVMLTRSLRAGSAPTVSSPFLTRLQMVLKGAGLDGNIEAKTRLIDINAALHAPAHVTPVEPPQPKPPVSARPKELPVTAIETLMRDPYSVYAKYVLKLRPHPPLDAMPTVAEKGTFIHAALDRFCKKYPASLPSNAREELLAIGQDTFKSRMEHISVKAFWWPRYERIVDWFISFEKERRKVSRTLGSEVRGKLEIDLGGGDIFTLTTIADRVDLESDDKLTLIDYKTGSVPQPKDIQAGFSPQLTLEALIACTGGFDRIDAHDVGKLQYLKLSGARPAGELIAVKADIDMLLAEAKDGIQNLVRTFNKAETPYLSTPRPQLAPRYRAYDHLSRRGEWSTVKKVEAAKKQRARNNNRPPAKGGRKP